MYDSLDIGCKAPDFSLIGTDGVIHTLAEFRGARAVVVMFLCNHCPYVIGCESYLKEIALKYQKRGVSFVAINSNCEEVKAEDSYEKMVEKMELSKFPWVYLHDSSQQIALKYGAQVTPHFFLFDQNKALIYMGRALDNPKHPGASSMDFLSKALDEYLDSKPVTQKETDPIGCTIKWSEGLQSTMSKEACYSL